MRAPQPVKGPPPAPAGKNGATVLIFARHANLKYKFGNRNFWATGYYVSTVGFNTATVQKYV